MTYIIKFIFRQFNGCFFLLIFFSVYKLISHPPNQISPLITKSFKKKIPPHRRRHNDARNWTVFSWQQAIKKKKTKSKENK